MKTCYFKILVVQLISKNLKTSALPLLTELNKGIPYLEKKAREGEILFISTAHGGKNGILVNFRVFQNNNDGNTPTFLPLNMCQNSAHHVTSIISFNFYDPGE